MDVEGMDRPEDAVVMPRGGSLNPGDALETASEVLRTGKMEREDEEPPEEPPLQCNIFAYVVLVAMGGAMFGLEISNISNAHVLMCETDFKETCGKDAPSVAFFEGLVTSCITIGAFLGTASSGVVQDWFGRKMTVTLGCVIYILGVVVEFLAPSYGVFVFGRIVVGVGVGWFASTVPLYIAELSPSSIRGRLVTSNQLNICIGIFLGYVVNKYVTWGGDERAWRYILGIGVFPAAFLFLCFLFITPRSPRWLVKKGRVEEARAVLFQLRGDFPEFVSWELERIVATSRSSSDGWAKLREPHVIRVVLIGVAISVIQQIVGVNSVNGYAPTILRDAGFDNSDALTMSMMIGVVKVGFVAVALAMMDCIGRKTLLIGGTVIMGVSMAVLGVLLAHVNGTSKPSEGVVWGSASMLFLAMASFELGQGPVVWLLLSEMFPLNVRGVAMSFGSTSNFLFNFLVTLTFPALSSPHALGKGGVFYLYAAICIVSCAFIWVYVPETKGKTLEEIESSFIGGEGADEARSKLIPEDKV